jgi:DHA2 family multidrug resistance protein
MNYESYISNLSGNLEQKLFLINQTINSQSALIGINDIMLGSGVIMLFLIPITFLAKKSDKIIEGAGH